MSSPVGRRPAEDVDPVAPQSHLAAIVESADDAIIGKGLDGLVISWNTGAERIYGYPAREMIGGSVAILAPPGHRDETPMILQRIKAGERIEPYETRHRRKDGAVIDVSLTVSPIRDPDGRIVGASSIGRDISRAKAAQRAALHLAAIVESSDDAVIGKNLDGIITSWNKGAERIYGFPARDMLGRSISRLALSDHQDEIPLIVERLKAGERIEHYETRRLRKDDTIVDISLTVSPIKDEQGRIVGASAVGRDITLARRAEQALREAHERLRERTEELAQSYTELERFAYVASHDLQEPARTVATFCELLQRRCKEQLDDRALEWTGFAMDGARRMQRLIADLLEYSRVQTRTRSFEPTECAAAVDEALENLRASIQETRARVTQDALPNVSADASQLVQVFQNLIGNALKFHGDRRPRVHISAERRDREWVFSVRDNGVGIEPQHRDQIFEVFRRLQPQGKYPGTGIGLAICKRVVERHRGKLWVESTPGRGSVFYFSLPVQADVQP